MEYELAELRSKQEMIAPARALNDLKKARRNRSIRETRVHWLASLIKRGLWRVTHQGVAYDREGRMVDGQHRFWAIVEAGVMVPVLCTYGLTEEQVEAIDKGSKRKLGDEFHMFRGLQYASQQVSYLKQCANIAASGDFGTGQHVIIETLEEGDEWLSVFGSGVQWATETFAATKGVARNAPMAGALAFAYETKPEDIAEFGLRIRDGVGLERDEPAYALRRHVIEMMAGRKGPRGMTLAPAAVVRKTLRAAMAHLKREKMSRVEDTASGVRYFQKVYDGSRKLESLIKPFRQGDSKAGARLSTKIKEVRAEVEERETGEPQDDAKRVVAGGR